MINFPKDAKIKGTRIEKKNKKQLEKTLRKLGNFKANEPIEILDYYVDKNDLCTIYEVKDLDNTLFKFYNCGLDRSDTNGFSQNYHLTMKRINSKLTYKYNFAETDYNEYKQGIRMIEASYPLTENRIIRLERKLNKPIRIIIEEDQKKYILVLFDQMEENDNGILKDFENIIERAKNIPKLNLENTLTIIKQPEKLCYALIMINEKIIANVDFRARTIGEYQIKESDVKITVRILGKITRDVERKIDNKTHTYTEEITEENVEKLHSDYKRLFKQL